MDLLEESTTLEVRQQLEWGEALTGLEQRNRFVVSDSKRGPILFAVEEGRRSSRLLLGGLRPITLWLTGAHEEPYLRLHSPFRMLFQNILVYDPNGRLVGRVVRNFSFLHPHFTVYDAHSTEIFQIRRNVFEIWTYRVMRREREVAVIRKQWAGTGREMFTDADNFRLSFGSISRLPHKQALLAAVFLIDKNFFENNNGSGVQVSIES